MSIGYLPVDRATLAFRLPDDFVLSYKDRTPKWGPLGYVTYKRTYARAVDSLPERYRSLAEAGECHGTEEWWLTVARVVEGCYQIQEWHCRMCGRPWDAAKALRSAREMYDLIWSFKFLPPGRGLWMMGTDYVFERGSAALNNCGYISTAHIEHDFARPFSWAMDMLMLGVGVGFGTEGAGRMIVQRPVIDEQWSYVVGDSREGWVDLLRTVLLAYAGEGNMPGEIDTSKVRPFGSRISGFGGTASGPAPLIEMIESIRGVLDRRVGSPITSADIVDVMDLIGRCVVAGNVRRSALLSLGHADDRDFMELKDPEKAGDALWHHRWASNNSITAELGMDYEVAGAQTAKNGEPGYVWLENCRAYGRMADPANNLDRDVMGVNPCSEQTLHSRLTSVVDPKSGHQVLGGELCCLAESFPANHENYAEYARTLKFAYLYGKTVTLLPTHDEATNEIMFANRRIGLSMSGIVQAMNRYGRSRFMGWCDVGYRYIGNVDAIYSDWLSVPRSIKTTSVKPSGTTSLLCGATPGIHFPESEFYWRVIRFSSDSPYLEALRAAGYDTHDLSPNEPNTTAVYFPVKEHFFDRGKADVSMWEQLEMVAQMQYYWADNAVSATVSFTADEAVDIPRALELYQRRLKAVSFLPLSTHGYSHAPYQPISREEYEAAVAKIRPITSFETAHHEKTERFCDGDKCEI